MHSNESIRRDNRERSREQIGETTTPRRFRWCVIPAAFSWCFGGVALLAVTVRIFHIVTGTISLDADFGWSSRMMLYTSIVENAAVFISGILSLLSGFRWVCSRWVSALVFNAIAFGLLMIPEVIYMMAMDAARQM